jgi:hypothetical protein
LIFLANGGWLNFVTHPRVPKRWARTSAASRPAPRARACELPLTSRASTKALGAALVRGSRRIARRTKTNVRSSTVGVGGWAAACESGLFELVLTLVPRRGTRAIDTLLRDKADKNGEHKGRDDCGNNPGDLALPCTATLTTTTRQARRASGSAATRVWGSKPPTTREAPRRIQCGEAHQTSPARKREEGR